MKNLKLLRERAHMTQLQLANYLHVTQQAVQRYESGKSESSYEILNNISNIFNVPAEYLIDDSTDLDKYSVDSKMFIDREEEEFINLFRKLDTNSQELVMRICRMFSYLQKR